MKKWLRFVALALILATIAGALLQAGAANIASDVNGDGKITAFDAQLIAESDAGLRTLSKTQAAAIKGISVRDIVNYLLSDRTLDAGDTNNDGIQEIYTAEGLQQLHDTPDGSFILMNDLDMTGIDWNPVVGFSGSFDGNGKTISNLSIINSAPSCYELDGPCVNIGFFGDTLYGAQIKNLHLENATAVATEDTLYLSLLVGSNRCDISGCTVTGTIYDLRESHSKSTFIGIMAGRLCNSSSGKLGSIIGGTSLSVTDSEGVRTTDGLCAKAAIVATDSQNIAGQGLVGWSPESATVSGIWADVSNNSDFLDPLIQTRRDTVVAYMNTMGTATWTPSEDLVYAPEGGGGKTYYKGTTYYGLPYNRGYGSYERFLSALNDDGTTKDGLGSCIWNKTDGYTGFVQLMGNHCSGAVSWAWMRVSPVIVTAIASHSQPYHGGAYVLDTYHMIPNESNRTTYGIYPIGDWSTSHCKDPQTNKITDAPYDAAKAVYQCTTENYSAQVLEANGADTIMEAYAHAHKGDALVAYSAAWSATLGGAGHARLMAADPIVIRNADNTIDRVKSYIITTEQGSSTGDTSTWKVKYRYSFSALLDDPADATSSGFGRTYLPITMRALHDTMTRTSYANPYGGNDAVTGPTKGKVFSNFRIISTTVTVKDGDTVIYNDQVFTGVSNKVPQASAKNQTADLAVHADGFAAAAEAAGLASGTYTFSVEALLSDGKTVNITTDQAFSYTAP